ncbi:MAG: class I SAM-dependent methyltransferase [Phycisphaerae bacterium]|nr:class I SAM-dependent methyltransferase [Phycisphaerae bacterium]
MEFYDNIADNYDEMTDANGRSEKIDAFIQSLISRYHPQSVLDTACGTGDHAIRFAQAGLRVTAADITPAMVERAQSKNKASLQLDFLCSPMQNLAGQLNEKFDLILCLGNSIPHLLTAQDLQKTIKGFANLLNPGGTVLIHLLNFPRILAKNERIVAVTRQGDHEYIRFYDFLDDFIQFNLLTVKWQDQTAHHNLVSTPLSPYSPDAICKGLRQNGLEKINLFANYNFNKFQPDHAPAVLIEAQR